MVTVAVAVGVAVSVGSGVTVAVGVGLGSGVAVSVGRGVFVTVGGGVEVGGRVGVAVGSAGWRALQPAREKIANPASRDAKIARTRNLMIQYRFYGLRYGDSLTGEFRPAMQGFEIHLQQVFVAYRQMTLQAFFYRQYR